MELNVKGSFYRDVAAYTNSELLLQIYKAIQNIKSAEYASRIHNLKKLRKYDIHYRIKIAGDYRIGILIKKNKIWFVRFGHRSSFYKKFP